MTNGPLQPYLSPSGFSTKTTGATVVPYAVRLPRNPTVDDRNYPVGSIWVNTATESLFGLGGIVGGEARWAPLGDHPLGDLRTLTGDSGGAVAGTVFNIDILGGAGSGITVVGNPATSTLEITTSSSYYSGTVTTVGAVTATALAIPVTANSCVVVEARVAGFEAADGVGGLLSVTAHRNGANLIVGQSDLFKDVPAALVGANFTAVAVGNTVEIQCTGSAGKTINWTVQAATTVSV
jgi:hypothetical protein